MGAVILYSKANGMADLHSHEGVVDVLIQQGTEDALVNQTGSLSAGSQTSESVTWFLLGS